MSLVELRGTPQVVDTFLRPIARAMLGLLGGIAGVLLIWFDLWTWVPIPLAVLLVGGEFYFWSRGDRPQTLVVTRNELRLEDPLTPGLSVNLSEITVATLFYRQTSPDDFDLAVVLGDDTDVRFAVRVLQSVPFPRTHYDVSVDLHGVLFGGIAGIFRALAPPACRPRQTFSDPSGVLIQTLRQVVPPQAWTRTGLRLWPGMEPSIDLFGYYLAPHSEWLVLDGHGWRRDGAEGTIQGWTMGESERSAVLFQGLADRQKVERLPLGLIHLGGDTTIAFPAPVVACTTVEPLTSDLLHTHAPEGAALIWHLLVHTPRDAWPRDLRTMVTERRANQPDIETALPGSH